MTIKFRCKNGHELQIDEYLLIENPQSYRYCFCGEKLSIVNINEIVIQDVDEQVKNNISKWFKTEGIEATIELIERNKYWLPEKIYNKYREELQRRGLIKC